MHLALVAQAIRLRVLIFHTLSRAGLKGRRKIRVSALRVSAGVAALLD